MEIFLGVLKKVTVFMIIGKTILNLGVGKEYEKYIKVIMAFMVILQIWAGINSTLQVMSFQKKEGSDFYTSWQEEMKNFEQELRFHQKEIEDTWMEYEIQQQEVGEDKSSQQEDNIQIEKIKIG